MSHLENNNQETYYNHLKKSFLHATISFIASISFVINGVFPNILNNTGSEFINNLNVLLKNKNY